MDKYVDFDLLKIRSQVYLSRFLKLYLKDIFHIIMNNYESSYSIYMNKSTFNKFLGFPLFISDRLFKTLDINKEGDLSIDKFINGLYDAYTGNFEISLSIVFNILDIGDVGKIHELDVKIILIIMYPKMVEEIELIIKKFFYKRELDYCEYRKIIEIENSDILILIIFYLYNNMPFSDKTLQFYSEFSYYDYNDDQALFKNYADLNKSIFSKPSKILSKFDLRIDFIICNSDSVLEELEKDLDYEIIMHDIKEKCNDESIKFFTYVERSEQIIDEKSDDHFKKRNHTMKEINDIKSSIYDHEDFIYEFENNLIIKYYMIMDNKNLFILSKDKLKFIKIIFLYECYIDKINEIEINNQKIYTLSLNVNGKNIGFYHKNFNKINTWYDKMNNILKYRNIYDFYLPKNYLSEGSFGQTCLSTSKYDNCEVAIKITKKSSKLHYEILKNEIEILKNCNHPNIVQYIDCFEDKDKIYLVEEFLCHGDLTHYIKDSQFSERRIKIIMFQLGQALQYLHHNSIIHRDIKLHNIMTYKENGNFSVKLIDFGLSKISGRFELNKEVLGTLMYLAPEIINKKGYSFKADVWSLGIILYYLLFNKFPFDDLNSSKVMEYIQLKELFIPRNNYSTEVINILINVLKKNDEERYDIDQFIEDEWFNNIS